MTFTRIALAGRRSPCSPSSSSWWSLAGHAGAGAAVVAFIAIAALVGAGNLLYGRHSHGAKALARIRPAQEAHDRAADVAAEARRAVAEAERRGERFCPLDPAHRTGRTTATQPDTAHVSLFRDKGVVLRTYRLGEADKIIVFLTERHGKVRAVAKGMRKTTSKFGGRLEPLTHVDLLLWQGRSDLDIVNQVEVLHAFRPIREDLDRMPAGMALLEVTDQMAQERHPDPRLYAMLVGALGALADADADPTLVAPSFFLKALVLEGAGPVLDECAACGEPDGAVELVAFDLVAGGTLCRAHRSGRHMSPAALVLLRRILGGDLAAVLAGPPPPAADEVAELATEAMEAHLDRRIRSVRSTAGL